MLKTKMEINMQKKIVALAIAAALTTPALASAATSVYGQANLSIDMVNDGAASSTSTNQLVSNASRVGFKGSEDLGSGNSVVWQMETTVGMDTGNVGKLEWPNPPTNYTTHFFDRDTFLGLSNAGMGTLLFGQHDTPYKMSTRKLDLFADTAADNRGMMGGHDVGLANVVAYVSPTINNMSVAAATVFGAESATSATGNSKKGSVFPCRHVRAGPDLRNPGISNRQGG
jgi:predicted porin